MKCPDCGNELRKSKKSDEYGLCDTCRQKVYYDEIDVKYDNPKKQSKKISICLFISFLIAAAYLIYSAFYWSDAFGSGASSAEQIGSAIATAMVMPHLVVFFIGFVFNLLGLSMNKRGFALTGGILYAVSIVLFPMYFMFVIIEMILSFVGFARMKKK